MQKTSKNNLDFRQNKANRANLKTFAKKGNDVPTTIWNNRCFETLSQVWDWQKMAKLTVLIVEVVPYANPKNRVGVFQ